MHRSRLFNPFLDFTRLDTACADGHFCGLAVHIRPNRLKVRLELAQCPIVGVGDVAPRLCPFTAYIAYSRHVILRDVTTSERPL